jgi:hypothetical protein
MTKKDKLKIEKCEDGKEFVDFARKMGGEIRMGKGDHAVVKGPRGQTVVPLHELGKGLRAKLVKSFYAIGLAVLVALFAYVSAVFAR